jgi:hypothetical protein
LALISLGRPANWSPLPHLNFQFNFFTHEDLTMKKYILAATFVLASANAMAAETKYCVAWALGSGMPTVAVKFSVTRTNNDHCGMGCENEWNNYLRSEYQSAFKFSTGILGPFDDASQAESAYRQQKEIANQQSRSFNHPLFSCSSN